MKFPILRPRSLFNPKTVKDDAVAGLVLGVESVPDGLASGLLLAGVNPVAGLYSYLFGLAGGALFTSTALMTIQGTGAMAIIVADVDLASRDDPSGALFTLSILTGLVMIIAGTLRLGSMLRFVSNSVMTGFITAVGINIVLGQLNDFTGYDAEGGGRVARTFDLLFNFWKVDVPTLTVGVVTIALIVTLQHTKLVSLGLVVAVFAGSGVAALFDLFDQDVAHDAAAKMTVHRNRLERAEGFLIERASPGSLTRRQEAPEPASLLTMRPPARKDFRQKGRRGRTPRR